MMQLLQIDRVEDEMIWTVINMRWVGLLFLLPRMETSSFSGPKRMFIQDSGCVLLLVICSLCQLRKGLCLKADIFFGYMLKKLS